MTSIIISGRPNSEEMSECIIVAENIANMYPSSRFTIVLKSPKEWEKYCEDLCNLFGILKKTHPLILFSNGKKIGGAQDFFKLISESFKYDKLVKKGNEYVLNIDPGEITKLTVENTHIIEKEYFCRTKGNYIIDKIKDKLDNITEENFYKYYSKYNTIETDFEKDSIGNMQVYVKYDNKFNPDPNDYINYKDIIENRPAYAEKEKYKEYHHELQMKKELEERLKREAEEAKRKLEEEQKKKDDSMGSDESIKEEVKGKSKKKKKDEEEKRKKEEEKKRKEEEEKKKKEEEEKKKKEEEKLKKEEEKMMNELGATNDMNPEEGKEEGQLFQETQEKVIKYKKIYFKCYSDFDIPYYKFNQELLIERFKEENFELLINPYFTFFGETLINKIKDYEAPPLPEFEEPVIEDEKEEMLPSIVPVGDTMNLSSQINDNSQKNKNTKKSEKDVGKDKKDNKFLKMKEPNNTANSNAENKKETPMNTITSDFSKRLQNNPINSPSSTLIPEGKIGGPTKSTEPNTYRPNFTEDKQPKDELAIKDFGRLPSLRKMEFGGDDLLFYQDFIPPYQLKEHILNNTNMFNFDDDSDIIDKETLISMIRMINETNGYVTYKVLPYNATDWKRLNTCKIKILPQKCKDIKNNEYPLVIKIRQQINKYKRTLFENNFTDNQEVKNLELILHNDDFNQCFSLPEFFTVDIYKKNNIPHLIKTFSKGTFIYVNVKFAINKMCEILEINNKTGYGYCLILSQDFAFMSPIKEPFTYTKVSEKNKDNEAMQSIPIYIEPYFFMGMFTLPYMESDWPESIKRKYIKFDLLDILKKSTN